PRLRDPGGSPFQMPARLADGLGLESDLGHGYPRPCAPSPACVRFPRLGVSSDAIPGNLVPPRWLAGRRANLGCSILIRPISQPGALSSDPASDLGPDGYKSITQIASHSLCPRQQQGATFGSAQQIGAQLQVGFLGRLIGRRNAGEFL